MAQRKLFGTDGIRGKANVYPMNCEVIMALGRAVAHYFQSKSPRNKKPLIILGKDTRLSCYMLEQAFSAGVCSQGGKVILTGPLPTPGVAFVTKSMRADAGVMISASHNKYSDNGIKIFDSNGLKLPDDVEHELERMVLDQSLIPVRTDEELGNAKRIDEIIGRYIVHVKSAFNEQYNLENMRLVLDCANGASYKVAPMVFSELGAEVFNLGIEPNGKNINHNCGSLYPGMAAKQVLRYRADLGLCFDGDADRIVVVDERGSVVDGDQIIGICAKLMLSQGKLMKGDTVVGTVMSNLGLEKYIESLGLNFVRTQVGDRYILEEMDKIGSLLGGEPSGHIIFKQYSSTGDGILAALKIIEALKYYKMSLKELIKEITLYPQVLKNTAIQSKPPLENVPSIQKALKESEKKLGNKGRILLRYSGTEPLARVMVEGEDGHLVESICNELVSIMAKELG
jgi:phosphoglucosamine mutase